MRYDTLTDPDFETELQRHTPARMELMTADTDERLRRDLVRKHRVTCPFLHPMHGHSEYTAAAIGR